MITLPVGFDVSIFVSEIVPFGSVVVGVSLAFFVYKIISKALDHRR